MSKYFSNSAIKGLNRIGDIMVPRNGEFPSFSEFGCVEHVDEIVAYAPASDLKDLNMVLTALSIMPTGVLKWLVRRMGESQNEDGALSVLFRQLDFGLKGIILSSYYSYKAGSNYKGRLPLDIIGYEINRVGLKKEEYQGAAH